MSIVEILAVADKLAPLASLILVPVAHRWLSVGRRAKTASLVAQLAQEVLRAVAHRNGVHAAQAARLAEAVEELERRLIRVGVDPAKAASIAADALPAAVSAEDLYEEQADKALADLMKGAKPVE